MRRNRARLAQKRLFTAILIIVGIFLPIACFLMAEFGDIYVRAVAVVLSFLVGYFIALFQSRL
jgi:VIT1/CCC1 family predicted Fe2+/Mn2+ transporter